jgi:hypothetical protein
MKVVYAFQTESEEQNEVIATTGEGMLEELRAECKYPVSMIEMPENTGHGCGVGDWKGVGESWDWDMLIDMHVDDFEALKDVWGLQSYAEYLAEYSAECHGPTP